MNRIVEAGQILSGRYQLTHPFSDQVDQPGAEFWAAEDTLLGKPVRILALNPQAPTTQPVLDAARRSALVDDRHLVRVLSVGDSTEVSFVTLENPKGMRLSEYSKQQLSGEETWNILGTLAQTLTAAQARGLRHYHVTPDDVWVTPEGGITLDGVGISAALAGRSVSEVPDPDADREEAHRLLGFGAGLLSGHFPGADDEVDSAITEALATPDLPEPLRGVFSREIEGDGTPNPRSIVRGLGAWPSVSFTAPPVEEPAAPEVEIPKPKGPKRKSAFGSDRFFSASRVREDDEPSVDKFPKITAPLGGDAAGIEDSETVGSPAPVSRWGGPRPQTPESPTESSPIVASADASSPDVPSPDQASLDQASLEGPVQPESTGATAVFKKIVDPEDGDGQEDEYYRKAASAGFAAGLASERESLQQEAEAEPPAEEP
ncbi:hypothetical protein, partial [Ancrocorticia populi]|uniref:hypothetical protein n=1 Tax=Ancrocorticia populi TaxID=2175228 RepID=UPI002352F7D7